MALVLNESATGPATSTYREWPPPPCWQDVVACTWEQCVVGGAYVQRVVPDGCADIVVASDGRHVVAGPARQVSLPRLEAGVVVRGLRLRCEVIGPVLGVPASELADSTVALDQVVTARRARSVTDMLVAGRTGAGWWADVAVDPRLRAACTALLGTSGSVADVAAMVGLSVRQLRRLLLGAAGHGPKTLQRVGRLQRFLLLAGQAPPWPPARLATMVGYADQAHLCREIRDLTGTTPSVLLGERRSSAVTAGET